MPKSLLEFLLDANGCPGDSQAQAGRGPIHSHFPLSRDNFAVLTTQYPMTLPELKLLQKHIELLAEAMPAEAATKDPAQFTASGSSNNAAKQAAAKATNGECFAPYDPRHGVAPRDAQDGGS